MSGQEHGQSWRRSDENAPTDEPANALHKDDLRTEIEQALAGVQFGEIKIIVRDGRIVQIERTTRNRPSAPRKFDP